MHIDSIQLFRVRLTDFTSSSGAELESVLVAMSSGDRIGFGEASLTVGPFDAPEWASGAFACIRDWMAPAIVGREVNSGHDLQKAIEPFQGNSRAKSALDMAWWNLRAEELGKPLFEVLGGSRIAIPVGISLFPKESIDDLLADVGAAVDAGYAVVTLKFRPGWDIQVVRAVRETFAVAPVAIDCDGMCSLGQQEMFYRLEDFFLQFIEQPFAADDLVGHAMLQQAIRTPICLDQSVTSLARVEQAIDLGSCRQLRIDVAAVGGLTPALAIREVCEEARVPCALGGGASGALAYYSAAALGTLPNLTAPAEAVAFHTAVWNKPGEAASIKPTKAGTLGLLLPKTPGPGIAIDLQILAESAVDQATIC
jgi:O-succinylbenzoate synthase